MSQTSNDPERFDAIMIYDLQKASVLKRAAAFILDFIVLCIVVTGVAMALSAVLRYDRYDQALEDCQTRYETQYGVKFDITQKEYSEMTEVETKYFHDAYKAFATDPDTVYNYNMVINLTLIITSLSILLGFLLMEFAVPIVLGNGQTIGKKIFGIGLMKVSGVKINNVSLFIRTVLGKFAIETMIPVLIGMMTWFGLIGIVGPVVVIGILVLQLGLMISSSTNAMIHDTLAHTVVVDLSSQMIFGSEDQLMDYKTRQHQEMVRRHKY